MSLKYKIARLEVTIILNNSRISLSSCCLFNAMHFLVEGLYIAAGMVCVNHT